MDELVRRRTLSRLATKQLECGIDKLYQAQGVPELAPSLCALDFLVSEAERTGLTRQGTLAQGASRCDFRYHKP